MNDEGTKIERLKNIMKDEIEGGFNDNAEFKKLVED